MEESIGREFRDHIQEALSLKDMDAGSYSPLALAYLGDCVYDLIVKTMILSGGNRQVNKLHEEVSGYVRASAQSFMMRAMQPALSDEEHIIYRRGRNCRSVSPAKNQTITDYRRATGFEALIGYLYLKREYARLMELVRIGLDSMKDYPKKQDTLKEEAQV